MDKIIEQSLRQIVEAIATNKAEDADQAIHEYICRKAQLMLVGEAEDESEDAKDDEDKDESEEDDDKSDDKDEESEDKDED